MNIENLLQKNFIKTMKKEFNIELEEDVLHDISEEPPKFKPRK